MQVQLLLLKKFTHKESLATAFQLHGYLHPLTLPMGLLEIKVQGLSRRSLDGIQGLSWNLATLKDGLLWGILADMLLSAVLIALNRMQYVVHKNSGQIEPEFNLLNKK